ncbi:MAG: winged helix-turn-helix transcriptional regulator [Methanobacteriaceae archaeon]|nr:winged helix-turn-helix transcriptional regulator [Methanobacteriaceae archaeon]
MKLKKPTDEQIKELRMILSKIPDDEKIERDASIIKALADPTRLKIVYFLQHGERCVCELIEALERPQPTISHHLTILKNAGILKWRKEGVWIHYRLADEKIPELIEKLLIHLR